MLTLRKNLLASLISSLAIGSSLNVLAENKTEEIVVSGKQSFSSVALSDSMKLQQTNITSINALIDNLPGVTVNEGDTFGFDDWSTSITVRGFSTNLGEQQVGTTIDGLPNGGSNYGGGAKANRYIDTANLGDVVVSLGTADIASRSHEALGGTVNFVSSNPEPEQRIRSELTAGEFDARRVYFRYDTGYFAGETSAWISISSQQASDWIAESAENERDHLAAKLSLPFGDHSLTAYFSYDDIHEDNYQRVYSEQQFEQFPNTDGLTSEWAAVPFEDQLFRRGWSTLRTNTFGYVKGDFNLSDEFELSSSVYFHQNEGRGDWLPPYVINAQDDEGGPESEITGGVTVEGGDVDTGDRILFVDADGNRLSPISEDCTPSYTVTNWYGVAEATTPAAADPSCYAEGAIPVLSFRNTHYEKDRMGLTLDATWSTTFGSFENEVRGGLWYEDQTRDEWRDWHAIQSPDGFNYASEPYWVQYSRSYPQETLKYYIQDSLTAGDLTFNLGIKQFFVDVEREDLFDSSLNAGINSDSDLLFSGGVVWQMPTDGAELFVGYSENFKALSDLVLERPAADLDNIEPETSETVELGLRYRNDNMRVSAVVYQNDFENRLIFVSPDTSAGPDFTIGTNGTYFNAGGIESEGLELSLDYYLSDSLSAYFAFTYTDATYLGTGDTAVDTANGINPGNTVAGIAENLFVASLDWSTDMFFAGISNKYTGERQVNQDNTWQADAFLISDVYAGANFSSVGEGLSVTLTINNAFDEEYLGTISSNAAWIGAPRTAVLSATLDF